MNSFQRTKTCFALLFFTFFILSITNAQSIFKPEQNVLYTLKSKSSNKMMDVAASSTANGTNILLWSATGNKNQQFRFVNAGGGFYFVETALASQRVIDIQDWGQKDGTNAQLIKRGSGTSAQKFKLIQTSSGYIQIVSAMGNHLYLGATDDNQNVVIRSGNKGDKVLFKLTKIGNNNRKLSAVADWMWSNKTIIGEKPLNRVVMPGTHNSGTYKMHYPAEKGWAGDSEWFKDMAAALGYPMYMPMAKCQEKSVYQQLMDGVRAIDIRTCKDDNGHFFTCHSLYGASIDEILKDVSKFNQEHPEEIVILKFSHFYDMNQDNKKQLANQIKNILGASNMISSTVSPTSTLNEIWKSSGRIAVLFDNTGDHQHFWPMSKITGSYKSFEGVAGAKGSWDKEENLRKTTAILNKHATSNNQALFVLNCELTLDGELIGLSTDPTSTYPGKIKNIAADANPVFFSKARNEWRNKKLNIIQVDYYNQTSILDLCKELNGIKTNKWVNKNSNWGNWKMGVEIAGDWLEGAAKDVGSWTITAASDAVNEIDKLLNGARVAQPQRGTTLHNTPSSVRHYEVILWHITCREVGSDGGGDIELYGSVSAVSEGKVYTNKAANQYLFHKRPGDRIILRKNQYFPQNQRSVPKKDFYVAEKNAANAKIKIVSRLMEHDDFNNDKIFKHVTQELGNLPVGHYKEYPLFAYGEDEKEKVQVYYAIKRIK